MNRMNTAFEKAMERVEQMDEPGKEEKLEWKLIPVGQRLAGTYIKGGEGVFDDLESFEKDDQPYLVKGMIEVFVSNVQIPKSEAQKETNARVIDGIRRVLGDRPKCGEALEHLEYVLEQYWQFGREQRTQAFEQLKAQIEQQVYEVLSRQTGGSHQGMKVNVEAMPEFQQQWLRISGQLNVPYETHLQEYKKQIMDLL